MLPIIQLIIAILLVTFILLQQRGSGLGAAFGGSGSVYRTKRGAEKVIFISTIILAILFIGLAFLNVYLNTQKTNSLPALDQPESADLPAQDQKTDLDQIIEEGTIPDEDQETEPPASPTDESENPFSF